VLVIILKHFIALETTLLEFYDSSIGVFSLYYLFKDRRPLEWSSLYDSFLL